MLGLVACEGETEPPTATTGAVSGASAARTLAALCEMSSATDPEAAGAAFYDRAHATLHGIAAAVGQDDRAAEGALLLTMQQVEADLERTDLPEAFGHDVEALRVATAAALELIGVPDPGCGA